MTFTPDMMICEIAKSLIDTPIETLVDMDEEPDIQIIRCVSKDMKRYVEFDERIFKERTLNQTVW